MTDPDRPPSTPPPTVPPPSTPPTTPPTNPPTGPGAPDEPPLMGDAPRDVLGDVPGATPYGGAQNAYGAPPQYGAGTVGPQQTLSLTAFIVGLASLVFCWVPVLGLLGAIAAVIIGFVAKGREPQAPKWMWLVGIISGFAAILLSLLILIPLLLLISFGTAIGTDIPIPTP